MFRGKLYLAELSATTSKHLVSCYLQSSPTIQTPVRRQVHVIDYFAGSVTAMSHITSTIHVEQTF